MNQIFGERANRKMFVMLAERYIGKSDPYIVMVSTPNAPGGLFYKIEKEPEEYLFIQTFEDGLYITD